MDKEQLTDSIMNNLLNSDANIQIVIDAWTQSLQSSQYIQNGFKAMSSGEEGSKKK